MNRIRNIITLIAVCATAAFLTGCGDDHDSSTNGGNNSIAPAALNGRTYTLTDAGAGGTIQFDAAANNYTLTQGGTTETGTFTATRSGDVWNVTTTNDAGTQTSQLTLTYTGNNGTGTYTLQRPGEAPVNGSFAASGSSTTGTSTSTGTDTGTSTSTGTNTGTSTSTGTDTGTSTSTGTNTGTSTSTGTDTGTSTSTGTTTGVGTVTPPATLSTITVTTVESGIGANSVYTLTFSGGTSGTFQARNTEGNATGSGTYNYTPNNANKTAALRLDYSDFPGDHDDMNLIFTTPPGGGANQFNGSQVVGGTQYNFTGTFTY